MPAVTPAAFDTIYGVKEAEICNSALSMIGAELILNTNEDSKQSRAARGFYAATRDELLRLYPFNFASKITLVPQDVGYELPMDQYEYAYKAEDHRAVVCVGANGASVISITSGVPMDSRLLGRMVYGAGIQSGTRITAYQVTPAQITIDRPLTADITSATIAIALIKILEVDKNDNNIFEVVGGGSDRRILCNLYTGTEDESPYAYILEMRYVERVVDPDQFDSMFKHALELRLASKLVIPLAKTLSMKQALDQEFSSIFQAAKISSSEERQIDEAEPLWSDRQPERTIQYR